MKYVAKNGRKVKAVARAAERGGQWGEIAPGPELLGAPEKFLLGPSLFCVLNISTQRTRYLVFLG